MSKEHYQALVKSLQFLSSVCDGASSQDGMGFNGRDTRFGKEMAAISLSRTLSPKQQEITIKLLQTYRGQIEGAGIELPLISEYEVYLNGSTPEEPTAKAQKRIELRGDQLFIIFPYDPELVNLARSLSKRRFDGSSKNWVAPAEIASEVVAKFSDFEIPQEVRELAGQPVQIIETTPERKIELIDGQLTLIFDYDPELVARCKRLSDRRFDSKSKTWVASTRIIDEVLAAFPEFETSEEVKALAQTQTELAAMSNVAHSDFEIPGIKGQPLPYQKAGVEFLELAEGRGIVADQMGLGKTLQSLAYLQLHPEARPAIIVVPASLKINWQREIDKWMSTQERVDILSGTKAYPQAIENASIIIINYDILPHWVGTLLSVDPQVLIADEAHYCKNAKAKRSKAVKELAGQIDRVILLTGTPITNRPLELFPLLNMVDPQAWPNFFTYAKRYCDAHQTRFGWDFGGASNLDELHQKIKPYVIRRAKEQVLKELPAKRRATITIEMDDKSRREYDRLMIEAKTAIEKARESGESLGAEHLALIEKSKQAAVKGKMKAALEWISDFIESGQKLIVFTTHTFAVSELMQAFGEQAVKVTGEDSQPERQQAVDRFQNDDSIRLFVGNIKAAGVGLTLTAASDVAFLELAWTPGDHEQAEDRAHRIGQESNVTAWYLLAENTIDEKIFNLLEMKRQVVDKVTDGKEGKLRFSILNELANVITA